MALYKLIIWSRFCASPEVVWHAATEFSEIADATPRAFRWEISNPEGLKRSVRAGEDGRFATRIRLPWRTLDLPLVLRDIAPGLRFTLEGKGASAGAWVHRYRFERAIGGKVRMVDELVLSPTVRPGRLWVEAVRRSRVAVHKRIAQDVTVDGDILGVSRLYVLGKANAAHARDVLGDLPDVG